MYFYYKGRPLLRWLGDVGLPSTDRGGGGVSRQTNATQGFTPQPVEWMFMNGDVCAASSLSIKIKPFFFPQAQEEAVVFLFIECFDQLLIDPPFLKIEF